MPRGRVLAARQAAPAPVFGSALLVPLVEAAFFRVTSSLVKTKAPVFALSRSPGSSRPSYVCAAGPVAHEQAEPARSKGKSLPLGRFALLAGLLWFRRRAGRGHAPG